MKGAINPDHIANNKYEFLVGGLIPVTAVEIGELKEELAKVKLPDRTQASGGTRDPVETEIMIPAHHTGEIIAMEVWYKEGQDPVLPTYKKPCTLNMPRISGAIGLSYTLIGVWVTGRGIPGMKMGDDGEMQVITFPISIDNILPI